MRPVAQVEGPQHRHADIGGGLMAANGAIEPAPTERRLAFRLGAYENAVVLQDIYHREYEIVRGRQVLRRDQLEIIC